MHLIKTSALRLQPAGRLGPVRAWWLIVLLFATAASQSLFGQIIGTNPVVRFHTDLGEIDVILLQDVAPNTVTNFLHYVKRGDYDNSFIHRSPPHFVVQGGGYTWNGTQAVPIPTDPPVANEFHVSNRRGTLAMAKIANQPNSATSQWFFNESDANADPPIGLDTQNGGFTVFGRIFTAAGFATMDTIGAVPVYVFQGAFDQVPLRDPYHYPDPIKDINLVHVIWVKVVPQIVAVTHPTATTTHIQGRGVASTTYKLQMSTSPVPSTFTTSVNVTTGTAGNFNYDDTNPGAKKFYRVAIP
jgi:cyclophilin family peptidyl-prolyl cis-trans isomerase